MTLEIVKYRCAMSDPPYWIFYTYAPARKKVTFLHDQITQNTSRKSDLSDVGTYIGLKWNIGSESIRKLSQ